MMIKKIGLLIGILLVFSFTTNIFAGNQIYVPTEAELKENESVRRSEIEAQIANNLKNLDINIEDEHGKAKQQKEVTLDLIGDVDTIKKSYDTVVKVYSETIDTEYSSLNLKSTVEEVERIANETYMYQGNTISTTNRLKALKKENTDFHLTGFYDYKVRIHSFVWSNQRTQDGVTSAKSTVRQRDAQEILDNYRHIRTTDWNIGTTSGGSTTRLLSPDNYALLVEGNGTLGARVEMDLYWGKFYGSYTSKETTEVGWNFYSW